MQKNKERYGERQIKKTIQVNFLAKKKHYFIEIAKS